MNKDFCIVFYLDLTYDLDFILNIQFTEALV